MVMVSALGMVIDEVVAKPGAIHATQVFKQFQCSVDCRLVHTLHAGLDIVDYLLRRKVPVSFMDDVKNHPTLWRQAKAILLECITAAHTLCNQLRL